MTAKGRQSVRKGGVKEAERGMELIENIDSKGTRTDQRE